MTNPFTYQAKPQTGGEQVSDAIGSLGRIWQGTEDQYQKDEFTRNQVLSQERKQAAAIDLQNYYNLLSGGDYRSAIGLLDNRINEISAIGGDPRDSVNMRDDLLDSLAWGDKGDMSRVQTHLGRVRQDLDVAVGLGLIGAPQERWEDATQAGRQGQVDRQTGKFEEYRAVPQSGGGQQDFLNELRMNEERRKQREEQREIAKIKEAKQGKEQSKIEAEKKQRRNAKSMAGNIRSTMNLVDSMYKVDMDGKEVFHEGFEAAVGAGLVPNMVAPSGTAQAGFMAKAKQLKGRLGFDKLQDMRDKSPTGGALGNVSEKELEFLQSYEANLDLAQDEEQYKEVLKTLRASLEKLWAAQKQYAETGSHDIPDITTQQEFNNLPQGYFYYEDGILMRKV